MQDSEELEICLRLDGDDRDPNQDDKLLARLAELARKREPGADPDRFDCVGIGQSLHVIAESQALLPIALARWLGSQADVRLGKALLHEASVTYLNQRFPQSFDLNRVPERDAITTARRLCALAAAPAISLGWALSMARDFAGSPAACGEAMDLLDYHVDQLLGSTVECLTAPESSFRDLDASAEALRRAREAQQVLEALPRLLELEMTADMRLLHSSLKRKEHREIHRRADEFSVFSRIAPQVKLKFASRPVIEVRDQTSTRDMAIQMFSQELIVELPLSELTDPVIGSMHRNRLWGSDQS